MRRCACSASSSIEARLRRKARVVRPTRAHGRTDHRRLGQAINEHLGTTASSLPELGTRTRRTPSLVDVPRVGDAFCGGGSIPFEAARIGCEAYGSDLNPVAALLTWGALNIVGGGEEDRAEEVRRAQAEVFQCGGPADRGMAH